MRLKDNPIFKEDYKKYQAEISSVTDENLKKELTHLLLELADCVAEIDKHHSNLLLGNSLPLDINESRAKLSACKTRLDTKLKISSR
jgi:hypothetical protein